MNFENNQSPFGRYRRAPFTRASTTSTPSRLDMCKTIIEQMITSGMDLSKGELGTFQVKNHTFTGTATRVSFTQDFVWSLSQLIAMSGLRVMYDPGLNKRPAVPTGAFSRM